MNKSMQRELDREYNEIFKDLYIDYMIKLKSEYEILVSKGLNTSGISITIMYNLVNKLVDETIDKIDYMINYINNTFEPIPLNDLKEYIEKIKKTINGHIDGMQDEICKILKDDELISIQTDEKKSSDIKGNCNNKLDQIYFKYKNIKKYKKIEWLVIINTIATVASFLISIIALLKD